MSALEKNIILPKRFFLTEISKILEYKITISVNIGIKITPQSKMTSIWLDKIGSAKKGRSNKLYFVM